MAKYQSKYQGNLDDLLQKMQNREFKYDVDNDAMYQMYKDAYTAGGQRAMKDTIGQSVALTGGYGNSWAQSAGQQAYGRYMEGLADKIPQLQQMAMDMYKMKGQQLKDMYGIYSDMDSRDYGRYRDEVNDDWRQSQFDYQKGRDQVADQHWQSQFDYNKGRDQVKDQQWREQFDYGKLQDQQAQKNWQTQFDYNKGRDQVADSHWQDQFNESKRQWEAAQAARAASGGSGGYYADVPAPANDTKPSGKKKQGPSDIDKGKMFQFIQASGMNKMGKEGIIKYIQNPSNSFTDAERIYLIQHFGITEKDLDMVERKKRRRNPGNNPAITNYGNRLTY